MPDAAAVRFQQTGGTWAVDTGPGCAGPWTQVLANQTTPTASPVGGGLLHALCVASGSPIVHGTLTALYNSLGQARSVNTLPLEQYVADTVPGESPSSWASLGGAGPQGMNWGFQELEAQAVAVRSYVLANLGGYGGYADTCDLTCQTYRGTQYETATSIAAANDTAGQVMMMPSGQIATTEYSASTGGYTSSANQQSPFTAVPDDGDAVCVPGACNPNHHWTTSVSYATDSGRVAPDRHLHRFRRRDVGPGPSLRRPRTGGWTPSRSTEPRGRITIPGTEFYVDLGLKSDLFSVTGDQRWRRLHLRPGVGSRHRDGAVGRARATPSVRTRRRELDLPADREPLLRPGPVGQPSGVGGTIGERRGGRLLDQRVRRRCVQLRQRAVLREHGRHAAEPAGRRHGVDARRRRLLGGGLRRRRVQLRRRPVPRQHRAASG